MSYDRILMKGPVIAAFFFISSMTAAVADVGHEETHTMPDANLTEMPMHNETTMDQMEPGEHMHEEEEEAHVHEEEEAHVHEEGEEHIHEGEVHIHEEAPPEYANLTNPYEDNESTLGAGKQIYEAACDFCHGEEGDGNGLVADSLKVKPADFTDREMVMEMSDGFWFWRVSEGIDGTGMPAWKQVLNETQRWQVINYAMNFSKGPVMKEIEEPPFYLLTEDEARKKGAHIIGLVANLSVILIAGLIFLIFKR